MDKVNPKDNKNKIIHEKQMKKIAKNLDKSLKNYRRTLTFMYADAPITILCLPDSLVNVLAKSGIHRIYDLLDRDLAEIKGIGETRFRDLTTRLNEFLAVL